MRRSLGEVRANNCRLAKTRHQTLPACGFRPHAALVRRLQNSTATVEAQLYGSTPAAWTNMSAWFRKNGKRVPTEQDLIGARDAVLRSQRTCKTFDFTSTTSTSFLCLCLHLAPPSLGPCLLSGRFLAHPDSIVGVELPYIGPLFSVLRSLPDTRQRASTGRFG